MTESTRNEPLLSHRPYRTDGEWSSLRQSKAQIQNCDLAQPSDGSYNDLMLKEFFPQLLRFENELEEARKDFSYRFDATVKSVHAFFASSTDKVLSRF